MLSDSKNHWIIIDWHTNPNDKLRQLIVKLPKRLERKFNKLEHKVKQRGPGTCLTFITASATHVCKLNYLFMFRTHSCRFICSKWNRISLPIFLCKKYDIYSCNIRRILRFWLDWNAILSCVWNVDSFQYLISIIMENPMPLCDAYVIGALGHI